jgi:hypothetical protein
LIAPIFPPTIHPTGDTTRSGGAHEGGADDCARRHGAGDGAKFVVIGDLLKAKQDCNAPAGAALAGAGPEIRPAGASA